MNATPPSDDGATAAAHEARIGELAVGFALGELDDTELRELYDALREPGERGLTAARLTWQQLGVVTDLRSGMGDLFQAVVKHRITREGRSDRFMRDSRSRLGNPRAALDELAAPAPAALRRWPWRRLGLAVVAAVAAVLLWWGLSREVLCRVAAVSGEATIGGEPLVVGMAIDHRQLVVPDGSLVSLTWAQRAQVEVSGPANVVAQGQGLSLANGALWLRAERGFTIGLPDDTATAAGGAACAITAQDGQSTIGVTAGMVTLSAGGRTLGPNQASSALSTFPWMFYDLQALPTTTLAVPSWRCDAKASWHDSAQQVQFTVSAAGSGAGWQVLWRPGSITIAIVPASAQPDIVPLSGAPLGESTLSLSLEHGRLAIIANGAPVLDEALSGPASLALPLENRAALTQLSFHSGPLSQPPAPGN